MHEVEQDQVATHALLQHDYVNGTEFYYYHIPQNIPASFGCQDCADCLPIENVILINNQPNTFGQLNHCETQFSSSNDTHEVKKEDVNSMHQSTENIHPNHLVSINGVNNDDNGMHGENTPNDVKHYVDLSNSKSQPAVEFLCNLCEITFHSLDDLLWHNENIHSIVFVCNDEMNESRTGPVKDINMHETLIELSPNNLQCESGILHQHNSESQPVVEFPCSDNVQMNDHTPEAKVDLKWHNENSHSNDGNAEVLTNESGHDSEPRFVCEICGTSLNSADNLQWHRDNIHRIDGSDQKTEFSCETCGIFFQDLIQLRRHKYIVHPKTKKSNPNASVTCDRCERSFKKQCYLTQHINARHNDAKVHGCPRCNKLFSTETERDEHYVKHYVKGQFVCQEANCGKRFHYNSDLRIHTRYHTKDLHYCSMCDKVFPRLTQLQYHHQKKHTESTKERKGKKRGKISRSAHKDIRRSTF